VYNEDENENEEYISSNLFNNIPIKGNTYWTLYKDGKETNSDIGKFKEEYDKVIKLML
jgi:hypothetical protein